MNAAVRLVDQSHYAQGTAQFPRVSSVLRVLADGGLPAAAIRRERELVLEHASALYGQQLEARTPIGALGFREALAHSLPSASAMQDFSDQAAFKGTTLHRLIHSAIAGNAVAVALEDTVAFREFTGQILPHLTRTAAAETPLISTEWEYGGTPDWCGDVEDLEDSTRTRYTGPLVIDWKRTSALKPKHLLQLSAYRQLAIENGLVPARAAAALIRITENALVVRFVPAAEADHHFTAFAHLLAAQAWHQAVTAPPKPTPPPTVAPRAIAPRAAFSFTRRPAAA